MSSSLFLVNPLKNNFVHKYIVTNPFDFDKGQNKENEV